VELGQNSPLFTEFPICIVYALWNSMRCRFKSAISPRIFVYDFNFSSTCTGLVFFFVDSVERVEDSPAPATICPTQACNGSAQQQPWARPAWPGPISQYALSSRPAAHAAHRQDVRDRRQTDRRQTASSLNAPGRGHNNIYSRSYSLTTVSNR